MTIVHNSQETQWSVLLTLLQCLHTANDKYPAAVLYIQVIECTQLLHRIIVLSIYRLGTGAYFHFPY